MNNKSNQNDFEWLMKKVNCVDHFRKTSAELHATCLSKQKDPKREYADKNIAALAGAFPIIVEGVGIVGTIGISGYEDSFCDHEAIVDGLKYLKKKQQK